MTLPLSMAQQIAQAAIAFEEQRLGRKPSSVTVVLGGDTLVITMDGVLSPAEKSLAASPAGAAKLQEFHQQLFQLSSDPMRSEIKRITGWKYAKTTRIKRPQPCRCSRSGRWCRCSSSPVACLRTVGTEHEPM